ncbi:MAG: hypothetical protein KA603_00460 [Azonexus sp.]|nr:hypothetical protein [Betaproteobacteria bacterium]MBK8918657.1 hypothetical protein [Betaproteobacteria bacterium]MBP6034590.1 hypothetical protein [Azonexus sp.]MBP6905130.1 hypothetical protein [Azonexus sp.]
MKNLNYKVIALAVSLSVGVGAFAEGMSKVDYKAGKDRISATYKTDTAGCKALSGNANDICGAEASGKEKVALAELHAAYKPNSKTHYDVLVAKADASYTVARERCDDKSGNAKDICIREAQSAETAAKADAKAQMKTNDANDKAGEASTDARKEASEDKGEARYAVAKEKCDTYAGVTKDTCLAQAKARFSKQ